VSFFFFFLKRAPLSFSLLPRAAAFSTRANEGNAPAAAAASHAVAAAAAAASPVTEQR